MSRLPLLLSAALIGVPLGAVAQDAPDTRAGDVPTAAVVIRLEGVTLSIENAEIEIAMAPEGLSRVIEMMGATTVTVEEAEERPAP